MILADYEPLSIEITIFDLQKFNVPVTIGLSGNLEQYKCSPPYIILYRSKYRPNYWPKTHLYECVCDRQGVTKKKQ